MIGCHTRPGSRDSLHIHTDVHTGPAGPGRVHTHGTAGGRTDGVRGINHSRGVRVYMGSIALYYNIGLFLCTQIQSPN